MAIKGLQKEMAIYRPLNMFLYGVPSMNSVLPVSIKISKKKNIKVLVENWLVRFI
jgi:hypothetical protein